MERVILIIDNNLAVEIKILRKNFWNSSAPILKIA
jgi:hypothetical protein